jgi:hypothetical protein
MGDSQISLPEHKSTTPTLCGAKNDISSDSADTTSSKSLTSTSKEKLSKDNHHSPKPSWKIPYPLIKAAVFHRLQQAVVPSAPPEEALFSSQQQQPPCVMMKSDEQSGSQQSFITAPSQSAVDKAVSMLAAKFTSFTQGTPEPGNTEGSSAQLYQTPASSSSIVAHQRQSNSHRGPAALTKKECVPDRALTLSDRNQKGDGLPSVSLTSRQAAASPTLLSTKCPTKSQEEREEQNTRSKRQGQEREEQSARGKSKERDERKAGVKGEDASHRDPTHKYESEDDEGAKDVEEESTMAVTALVDQVEWENTSSESQGSLFLPARDAHITDPLPLTAGVVLRTPWDDSSTSYASSASTTDVTAPDGKRAGSGRERDTQCTTESDEEEEMRIAKFQSVAKWLQAITSDQDLDPSEAHSGTPGTHTSAESNAAPQSSMHTSSTRHQQQGISVDGKAINNTNQNSQDHTSENESGDLSENNTISGDLNENNDIGGDFNDNNGGSGDEDLNENNSVCGEDSKDINENECVSGETSKDIYKNKSASDDDPKDLNENINVSGEDLNENECVNSEASKDLNGNESVGGKVSNDLDENKSVSGEASKDLNENKSVSGDDPKDLNDNKRVCGKDSKDLNENKSVSGEEKQASAGGNDTSCKFTVSSSLNSRDASAHNNSTHNELDSDDDDASGKLTESDTDSATDLPAQQPKQVKRVKRLSKNVNVKRLQAGRQAERTQASKDNSQSKRKRLHRKVCVIHGEDEDAMRRLHFINSCCASSPPCRQRGKHLNISRSTELFFRELCAHQEGRCSCPPLPPLAKVRQPRYYNPTPPRTVHVMQTTLCLVIVSALWLALYVLSVMVVAADMGAVHVHQSRGWWHVAVVTLTSRAVYLHNAVKPLVYWTANSHFRKAARIFFADLIRLFR